MTQLYQFPHFPKGIIYAVTTKQFGSMVGKKRIIKNDLKKFFSFYNLPFQSFAHAKQTHSSNIVVVKELGKGAIKKFLNADGFITKERGVFLGIKTSDCVSVVVYAQKKQVIGVIHAGYKGLLNGVLDELTMKLKKLNVLHKDIQIYIGPSIRNCCYNVPLDRVNLFKKKFSYKNLFIKKRRDYFLSLQNIIQQYFIEKGIRKKNIFDSKICTQCESKIFFSLRADGSTKSGQNMTIVGMV